MMAMEGVEVDDSHVHSHHPPARAGDTQVLDDIEEEEERTGGAHEETEGYVADSDDDAAVGLNIICDVDYGNNYAEKVSSVNKDYDKNLRTAVASKTKAIGLRLGSDDRRDETSTATNVGEVGQKFENSHKCLQNYYSDKCLSRINKSRVRKLYSERTGSCIGSQEPSELSQAIAMDVVDNLLCDNDMASSQSIDYRKAQGSSSPPNSSARGCQFLVKWASAHDRSSIGKSEIFDWADDIADGGRSGICIERTNCFSKNQVGKQGTQSCTMKARHLSIRSSTFGASVHKSKEKEENLVCPRTTDLTFPDPKLLVDSPIAKGPDISEADRKDYGNENYEMNSTSPERHEATHDGDMLEMPDIGPNTQMAAEAMEALFYASPVNHELRKDSYPSTGILTKDSSTGMPVVRISENIPLKKRWCSTSDLEGNIGQSNGRKVVSTKLSKRSSISFREQQSNSGMKRRKLTKQNTKVKNNCDQPHLNGRNPPNAIQFTRSFKHDKECNAVERTFKEGNKCGILRTSNMQHPVSKRAVLGELPSNIAPVAHRTRQSKSLKLSKLAEPSFYNYGRPERRLFEATPEDKIGDAKLVADASRLLNSKSKGPKKGEIQVANLQNWSTGRYCELQDIEEHHKEETKISSTIFSYPKCRRTNRNTSGKMKNTSFFGCTSNTVQSSVRQGVNDILMKSPSDILISVKRKKRSTCARRRSSAPGLGVNSSFNSPLVEPCLRSDDIKLKQAFPEVGSVFAMNNLSSVINNPPSTKEVASLKQGAASAPAGQDMTEKAELDGSFGCKDQMFGLACSTSLRSMDSDSPATKARGHQRISHNKGSRKLSFARELIRLEATEAPIPCLLKASRRRKDMASIRVLFSNHLDEDIIKQQKKILARLGIPVASSTSDATHFVSDKFARTKNMLEMIAMGKPVVTPMWLNSCGLTSYFIDDKKYILRDVRKENEIGFNMPASLDRAHQRPLLQGRRVFITPNVKPDRELVASLVKAAQGQAVESIWDSAPKNDKLPEDLLVISCEDDYALCSSLLDKGAKVFSSELLLNGIVVQKLEFERHCLFSNHCKKTCSSKSLRSR